MVCSFEIFLKKLGRRELYQNEYPVTVAGLTLAGLSPRVHSAEEFQKGGHLQISGSGSSPRKCVP